MNTLHTLLTLLLHTLTHSVSSSLLPYTQTKVAIHSRDEYVGFVSEVQYSTPRCISAIRIVAEEALTGAEEIDVLYSACPNDALRLLHYRNDESLFFFGDWVWASRLLVSSHSPLRISSILPFNCSALHRASPKCEKEGVKKTRKHRRHPHKKTTTLRVGEDGHDDAHRSKREATSSSAAAEERGEFRVEESPYTIIAPLSVPQGRTFIIHGGTTLAFAPSTAIHVHGALRIEGSEKAPVYLTGIDGQPWDGLFFHKGYNAADTVMRHVNISQGGVTVSEGALSPSMHTVVVQDAQNAFTILTDKSTVVQSVVGATSVSSRHAGFTVEGEV